MSKQRGFAKVALVIVVLVIVAAAGYFAFVGTSRDAQQPTATSTATDLDWIFGLNEKEAGTKVYYSEQLGVGFTYLPYEGAPAIEVTESGSKMSVGDQSIEVFEKAPSLTLEEAIESRFLQGYDPKDCFVEVAEKNEQGLSNYVSAEISYPPTDDPEAAWWKNSEKCPQAYSKTNGMQYFLMNKEVPGKFLFVRIGQYSAASDGTPQTANGGSNWTHSIRIVK